MLINTIGIMRTIVQLIENKNILFNETKELCEKFATAENLKNIDEMFKIGIEGHKLQRKSQIHYLQAETAMTMVKSVIPNYRDN